MAGVAEKNVTLGVPRLKELLDTSKNMKTPSLTIALRPPYQKSEKAVLAFTNSLERTHLEDVVRNTDVIWDPELLRTDIKEDVEIVEDSAPFYEDEEDSKAYSRWVVRLELSKLKLLIKNYSAEHVIDALQAFVGDKAYVIGSSSNMNKWVIRVRLANILEMTKKVPEAKRAHMERVTTMGFLNCMMKKVIIGGIKGIEKATYRKISVSTVDEKTRAIKTNEEMVIDTEGSALTSIWTLPPVDWQRTYTNDVNESNIHCVHRTPILLSGNKQTAVDGRWQQ